MRIISINKYLVILGLLLILDCSLGGFIGVWRDWYWSSISNKDLNKWLLYLSEFAGVALLSCWVSGYSQYLGNIVSLSMRTNLTRRALRLNNHSEIEGGTQRVQEDCKNYPLLLIGLLTTFLRSIIMIVVFAVIILVHLPWYYLLIPLIYSAIGTLLAGKIAFPLVYLNYINQVVEAKFRQVISKLNYAKAHRQNFLLFKRTKYLAYFQSFYNQITVIIPHIILAVLYFTGRLTFGVFMQMASSMAEITNSLSIVIYSLNDINNLLSCRRRLKELTII